MQSSQMVVSRRTLLLSAAVAAATLQGKLPSKAQAGTLMSAPGQSAASYDTEPALKSAVRRTGRVSTMSNYLLGPSNPISQAASGHIYEPTDVQSFPGMVASN